MARRISLRAALFAAAAYGAAGLEVRLEGDRLWIDARRDDLREVLGQLAYAGVVVRLDPGVRASVSGRWDGEDAETALKQILAPFGYALIWDVVEGPLGRLPKLAEVHVFRPGHERAVRPLVALDPNFQTMSGPAGGPEFVRDEILIALREAMRQDEFRRLIAQIGGTVVDSVAELGIYRVRLLPGLNVPALAEQLARHPKVQAAEPNFVIRAPEPQAAPALAAASGPTVPPPEGAAPVAVLDSGLSPIDLLGPTVRARYDAVMPGRALADPVGHGTQMALVASGVVAPIGAADGPRSTVPLVAVRAFDDHGCASTFALARSIAYALKEGAKVLSLSWGSETPSAFLELAVAYAQSRGALVVAAAGNEPTGRAMYPAAFAGVLAVSATGPDGARWQKSNYGEFVGMAAPGYANFPVGYRGPPGTYVGTSVACAYAAWALGCYWSQHPDATREEVLRRLAGALTDAGPSGRDPEYGQGVLDAAALRRLFTP